MSLTVEKVRHSNRKNDVKRIYFDAFPTEPRMPFPMMVAMSYLWNTEFLCYYDGDTLCGLIYLATVGHQTFIMFFAVDEKLRLCGYGSQILECVQKVYPKIQLLFQLKLAMTKALKISELECVVKNSICETDIKKPDIL